MIIFLITNFWHYFKHRNCLSLTLIKVSEWDDALGYQSEQSITKVYQYERNLKQKDKKWNTLTVA